MRPPPYPTAPCLRSSAVALQRVTPLREGVRLGIHSFLTDKLYTEEISKYLAQHRVVYRNITTFAVGQCAACVVCLLRALLLVGFGV